MNLWAKLFTIPAPTPLTDKKQIDQAYRHWRWQILVSMYAGYALFYFTRKSFTFITPALIHDGLLTTTQVGLIASAFYVIYGCSKFISGIISDRANARYFMALGLFMTGLANIAFSFSHSLVSFFSLWLINAFFQGWGWPPCAKLLTHWYSQRERGRWWGGWNTCHNVGGFLTPNLIALSLLYGDWRLGMWLAGGAAIVMACLLLVGLRDTPRSLGLPPIEQYKHDTQGELKAAASTTQLDTMTLVREYVLTNASLWILAIAYVLVYVVRTAINDWGALYLTDHGYSLAQADQCLSLFEVGGVFGSLAAGWLSDYSFAGARGQTNVLFCVGALLPVGLLWAGAAASFWVTVVAIFFIGFFIFGPQMLIGVAAAELSHKKASGAATGFIGLFGYLGAALSGYPIATVLHYYGWNDFFAIMLLCLVLAFTVLLKLWSKKVVAIPQPPSVATAAVLSEGGEL